MEHVLGLILLADLVVVIFGVLLMSRKVLEDVLQRLHFEHPLLLLLLYHILDVALVSQLFVLESRISYRLHLFEVVPRGVHEFLVCLYVVVIHLLVFLQVELLINP